MAFIYPGGDEQVTPNLGLATWGMDEVLAENMILIDTAIGGGGSGSAAWAKLTGDLTINQVVPWDGPTVGITDTGISRIGVSSLAIGNGTAGDITGSLTLGLEAVGAGAVLGGWDPANATDNDISSAPNNTSVVDIYSLTTAADVVHGNSAAALAVGLTANPSSDSSQSFYFGATITAKTQASNSTNPHSVWALSCIADNAGAGNVHEVFGHKCIALNTGSAPLTDLISGGQYAAINRGPGTVTDVVGFNTATGSSSGPITNNYGVVIGAPLTAGLLTNNYALYITYQGNGGANNPNPWGLYCSSGMEKNFLGSVNLDTGLLGSSGNIVAWSNSATTAAHSATADTGISRLGAASLAIGNGTASSTTGNLSFNRVSKAGADFAGQATITAGQTTKAVSFVANYAGTGQPVIILTPTSDPLALGVPVGYWITYSGGAGAWTGFSVNIQTALAGNVTFNYLVVGVA